MACIFVVDGQPSVLRWMEQVLSPLGHDCRCFLTASAALRETAVALPQLLVTDARMPDMNATRFVDKLHDRMRDRMPPVLLTSARGAGDGASFAFIRSRLLPKPFGRSAFVAAVRALLPPEAPQAASGAGSTRASPGQEIIALG